MKTCNWNCVYCQLGRSVPIVADRSERIPRKTIADEVERALSGDAAAGIDWVTFVGSGETTLHPGLGWMIRRVKEMTSVPIAVITNGSLLRDADVRAEVGAADAVLPSLDAGTPRTYRRMNRAHPSLDFDGHVRGLETFARGYKGRLWMEVMLVSGVNDGPEELGALVEVLDRIGPDQVHLLTPDRPACEPWVRAPERPCVARAAAILGGASRVVSASGDAFMLDESASALEAILGIIGRHPMGEDEMARALSSLVPERSRAVMDALAAGGRVRLVERGGRRFWVSSETTFPESGGSASAGAS